MSLSSVPHSCAYPPHTEAPPLTAAYTHSSRQPLTRYECADIAHVVALGPERLHQILELLNQIQHSQQRETELPPAYGTHSSGGTHSSPHPCKPHTHCHTHCRTLPHTRRHTHCHTLLHTATHTAIHTAIHTTTHAALYTGRSLVRRAGAGTRIAWIASRRQGRAARS